MRLSFLLSALAIALCAPCAPAALITLDVTGVLIDSMNISTDMSGTITIDNVAGLVTAADVILAAPNAGVYDMIDPGQFDNGAGWVVGFYETGGSDATFPQLGFIFPVASLVGYTGGTLCSVQSPCYSGPEAEVSGLLRNADDNGTGPHLNTGSDAPAITTGTPEPGSLTLLGLGLAGVVVRRLNRRNFIPQRRP